MRHHAPFRTADRIQQTGELLFGMNHWNAPMAEALGVPRKDLHEFVHVLRRPEEADDISRFLGDMLTHPIEFGASRSALLRPDLENLAAQYRATKYNRPLVPRVPKRRVISSTSRRTRDRRAAGDRPQRPADWQRVQWSALLDEGRQ